MPEPATMAKQPVSDKQLRANRLNAQASTGPRTKAIEALVTRGDASAELGRELQRFYGAQPGGDPVQQPVRAPPNAGA